MNHLRTNLISTVTEHLNYDTMQKLGQSRNTKTVKAYLNAHADVPRKILDKIGNINDLKDFNHVAAEIQHLMGRPMFSDGKGLAPIFSELLSSIADFSGNEKMIARWEVFSLMSLSNLFTEENLRGATEEFLNDVIAHIDFFPNNMKEAVLLATVCAATKTDIFPKLMERALIDLPGLPEIGWEQRVVTLVQACDDTKGVVANILHRTLSKLSREKQNTAILQIMATWDSSHLYSSGRLMNLCYALAQLPAEQQADGFEQLENKLKHPESRSTSLVGFFTSLDSLSPASALFAFTCAAHLMKNDPELRSKEALEAMIRSCYFLPHASMLSGLQEAVPLIPEDLRDSTEIRNAITQVSRFFHVFDHPEL